MSKIIEITWHGRGGQGAVTAAKLVAAAALLEDKYVQAFPEYGAERSGAPVRSFTRISEEPIYIHCSVKAPHIVVVLDPTLLNSVDVTSGLPKDGVLIINTPLEPSEIRKKLKLTDYKIFTVDATAISIEKLKKNIPNTPMVGALLKVGDVLALDTLLGYFKKEFARKFRPEILDGNVDAIKTAYDGVKGE